MNADVPNPTEQVWDDLAELIGRAKTGDPIVIATDKDESAAVIAFLAVNQNAGHAAQRLIHFVAGRCTDHDVARALTDVITSAFVALSYVQQDPREYWEISLSEMLVITE